MNCVARRDCGRLFSHMLFKKLTIPHEETESVSPSSNVNEMKTEVAKVMLCDF